ncbi:MAG: hypothetical protein ABI618_18095, partial [Nitrospirota bacterium]
MMRVCMFLMVLLCVIEFGWELPANADDRNQLSTLNLPSDPISFQPGPGSDLASRYCLMCHSAEYVYMQ